MGLYHLDKIFRPTSIAVIGASETRGSIGQVLMANLTQNGYGGRIIPVNPKYSEVAGLTAYSSISDADQTADLAVIATPMSTVPGIVRECVAAGVSGAVIISAGGKETGKKGQELEQQIEQEAKKGGLRIIGPNCMGFIRPDRCLNASFTAQMPPKGKTAFISQSGVICSAMLDLSFKENMGFRYFISIGSMLDVDFGDLIDYLGDDPQVTSILLYISAHVGAEASPALEHWIDRQQTKNKLACKECDFQSGRRRMLNEIFSLNVLRSHFHKNPQIPSEQFQL